MVAAAGLRAGADWVYEQRVCFPQISKIGDTK